MGFTVKQVEKLIRDAQPGATAAGDGLYLKITPTGHASWQLRYQINGKRRAMGLGACERVTLADARVKAVAARAKVKAGVDPLEVREADDAAEKARQTTFKDIADDYIKAHRSGWRNAKHGQQWENTLSTYAFPKIGDKAPAEITTADVLSVVKPIWQTKPETASRIRNRIELVLDAARAQGLSSGSNPAAWRGHLNKLLPKRTKASKTHHAALDYRAMPAFYERLRDERASLSSAALRLTILTACRTSEVLNATWDEVDLDARIWTIPANRMKGARPHRVPLSVAVVDLLKGLGSETGYLFPGTRPGRPLSNMSMAMVLRKMGHAELTVHGMRSTFRDWAAEETHYPNVVCEMALAHSIGNAAEAAYRRGDLLEKRRAMMQDWAGYCGNVGADHVVSIATARA